MAVSLLSMTGHGEAHRHQDGIRVAVEVRTVNNRFLKVSLRLSDGFSSLDPLIEAVVRKHLRRGAVSVSVRVERESSPDDFQLNAVVLDSYYRQLQELGKREGWSHEIRIDSLLGLPGAVMESASRRCDADAVWPVIEGTLNEALENLSRMRAEEGAAMGRDLHANCQAIAADLDQVEQRAPLVIEAYRRRLLERINKLLEEFGLDLQSADVVREVGLFTDRSDISEEVVRLRSHLQQFDSVARTEQNNGRKLEFLIQEMLRETNTIGSKANDAEIARHVVEIKTAIERLREMIQNVE
jgi:uncharacterized protein (TIGR00255 family)